MDPIPITIVVVLLTLTLVIVILSIQVWNILKEFNGTVSRMNKILDDAGRVSETVGDGAEQLSGVVSSIRSVSNIISTFRRKGDSHVQ